MQTRQFSVRMRAGSGLHMPIFTPRQVLDRGSRSRLLMGGLATGLLQGTQISFHVLAHNISFTHVDCSMCAGGWMLSPQNTQLPHGTIPAGARKKETDTTTLTVCPRLWA